MQTFTPLEYLKIDIASNFGLEKESWDDRIAWFDANEQDLNALTVEAEEPAMFFAGIRAWEAAKAGRSISYPVSLDATASGAQLLAALIGCDKSARLCNVVDTGSREDLYTNIYQLMDTRLQNSASAAAGSITRSDAKTAIMTSLYGSTAQPRKIFGEGDQLAAFYGTMEDEAPGIWELNQALVGLWQSNALSHDWVLPDNFHVKTKVMGTNTSNVRFLNAPHEVVKRVNKAMPEGLAIGANVIHSLDGMVVREILRRCTYNQDQVLEVIECLAVPELWEKQEVTAGDKLVKLLWERYQESGFLSARILDHLCLENMGHIDREPILALVEGMPDKPFSVLTVHDCFRVHPNHANDLRRQYNQLLSEIAASDLLASIASQIVGEPVSVTKFADISSQARSANYALS